MATLGDRRRARLEQARLYLILEARPQGREPGAVLMGALRGGVDIVQLREKELADDALVAVARVFRSFCDEHGALFILNDRPDLVAAALADGVHVGQGDVPVAQARAVVGADALVGLSTHSLAEIRSANGADYIGVGPVWATPTKPGRPAVGLDLVRAAAAEATVPFFAIGGIDLGNAAAVVAAGATRLSVRRAISSAEDPEAAARRFRHALS